MNYFVEISYKLDIRLIYDIYIYIWKTQFTYGLLSMNLYM